MAAGDLAYWSDIANAVNRPLVRLLQQSAQSLTDNTDTAITFGASSEDIDTHGFHDTASNTSRVTPTVAGYYRVTGTFFTTARADYATLVASIYKNGAVVAPRVRQGPNATSTARSLTVTAILSANGGTDYFELWATQDNAANVAANTSTGGSFTSVLEVEYLRPL